LREQDAFQILACKEIRISSNRGSSSDSADIDEEGGDCGASAAAATGRAATQAVRKGLIQNTIPIFIELKRLLESKNSPLIGSLMECLRVLLKDYKNEIDDILVADKQLQRDDVLISAGEESGEESKDSDESEKEMG
jgi:condensin-2 complex subunit D3